MPWKNNNAPHRNALNFGAESGAGVRRAKHAKGTWSVLREPDGFYAWRAASPANVFLGNFTTQGLAMSACARDCKEQP